MAHKIDTMAWTGEKPWHKLGVEVPANLTPAEIGVAAGLNWTVSKTPIYYDQNGVMVPVPDRVALIRDDRKTVLSVTSPRYNEVQNEIALGFFDQFVKAGQITMETAGSLAGGRYIWALARLNKDFKLAGHDQVNGYVLLMQPHAVGRSMIGQFTPVRVVCWNTLTYAIGNNLKGSASAFRMPHSQKFDEKMKERAALTIGLATAQMTTFEEAASFLASKTVPAAEVEEFFTTILKFDPTKAEKNADGLIREPRALPKLRAALISSPGANLASAEGTIWGAFNAVSAYTDHIAGRSDDTRLQSAWLGQSAALKRRAFDLAVDWAKRS